MDDRKGSLVSYENMYGTKEPATPEDWALEKWDRKDGSCSMLTGIPEERKRDVAMALEHQRILNEWLAYDDTKFKRISIPMVRRIMGAMPELRSKKRTAANCFTTSICMKSPSMVERFNLAWSMNSLDREADQTFKAVEDLKLEIKRLMRQFGKTTMLFLGLAVDDQNFLCFYYDWE